MRKNRTEVIEYINSLKEYEGYVQFSHRPLEKRDIFENSNPSVSTDEKGFVYEAHFCNGIESIMVRQQNREWIVSKTDISDINEKDIEYFAFEKTSRLEKIDSNWVKMAQIWKSQPDELCEGMKVNKLQKVVFAGFSIDKKKGEAS